jgi:hypothetical protein
MKKPLSKKMLMREATFWEGIKMVMKENPGKVCHK